MGMPRTKWIGDREYKATPALVNTKFPDGSPRLITLLNEDSVVSLAGGEEFVIVYAPIIDWKKEEKDESKDSSH